MGCEQIREALSARLDGEDDPAERATVDAHLAGCPGCTTWLQAAAAIAALAQTQVGAVAARLPEEGIKALLAAAPGRRRRALVARGLRLALGVVGVVQLLLGVVQVTAIGAGLTGHAHTDPTSAVASGHLWHESAAWNIAVGAGFAWIAWRRSRPAGILPILTVFVAVLALLTANDAVVGRVEASRILSHGFVLAGYVILLVLGRPRFENIEPPTGDRARGGWRLNLDEDYGGPLATVHHLPVQAAVSGEATARSCRAG